MCPYPGGNALVRFLAGKLWEFITAIKRSYTASEITDKQIDNRQKL
ncbi:hypothetical protein SPFM20_00284 [Salmonella phage SPFM20]|nr:hypothetical protein SPFM20_00284 [Salmonella phage SPFM20]